jgi:uncharacterized membrane protein YhaH (DUF805 family)
MLVYRYIFIILLQAVLLFSIRLYSKRLESSSRSTKECDDMLNRTLFELRFCMWNIIHIFVTFAICVIMKPRNLGDHMLIFAIGVVWFFIEYVSNSETTGAAESCPEAVYDNMLMPRLDDFLYNTLGQVLYILVFKAGS